MYRRRQTESTVQLTSTGAASEAEQNGHSHSNGQTENDLTVADREQVKFRGSMSSVDNRHERVPSKPMVMTITTPKGTRHVADAFGDFDGKEDDLPGIDEDGEEEYDNTQSTTQSTPNTQNNDDNADRDNTQQTETETDPPPESAQSVEVAVHSESVED